MNNIPTITIGMPVFNGGEDLRPHSRLFAFTKLLQISSY